MNAVPALPVTARFQPVTAPASHGGVEEAWREERDRLPPGLAYPIILLLSVGGWAVVATVGLWLYRILG
ncbi:MAG: hypothetical protein KGK10_04445 [Rhodospirillales bacterium]|nr:hypothetical protein [Rhodospirillales bacterium]